MEEEKKTHSAQKKAASGAVAVITAASLMVSGAVESPTTLLSDENGNKKASHTYFMRDEALETGMEEYSEEDEDEEDDDEEDGELEEETLGFRRRVRQWIMAMPVWSRALFILPLWLIGSGLTFAGGGLWTAASPLVMKVLRFVLLLGLLFAGFLISAKVLHPDLPLKKFLNKRTLPTLLIGGILLCILDLVLTVVGVKFPIKDTLVCVTHLGILTTALIVLTKHLKKTKEKESLLEKAAQALPKPEKPRKPAVVFTDATGVQQRIKFRDEK